MMTWAFEFDNCRYINIPNTCGCWMEDALNRLGIEKQKIPLDSLEGLDDKPNFCFIDEQEQWYLTWWHWWNYFPKGSLLSTEFDNLYDPDIEIFISRITKEKPDALNNLFKTYTSKCDYVGTRQTAKEDLIAIFTKYGEKFDPEIIMGTKYHFIYTPMPEISEGNKEEILKLKNDIYETYANKEETNG